MLANINDFIPKTLVSSHEDADTLMMLHALEIAETREGVDFFSQNTDWMVLILKRMDYLDSVTHFSQEMKILGRQLSFTQSMNI